MSVISTTIEYEGQPIKIENGKAFGMAFGTTITNHNMHWSWTEITPKKYSELERVLVKHGYEK